MLDTQSPVNEPLPAAVYSGRHLRVRTASTERDVERVAEFNGLIHSPGVAGMTRNLFLHHPHTSGRDLFFVEDETDGRLVSSLCLIPWTWQVDGAEIRAGEMGIVGTLETHRRQGLIRAQVPFFKRRLRERGCVLSHIQGIPYFYRQFGYEYAMPLEGGLRLEHRDVPRPDGAPFTFRPASVDDVPVLDRMYSAAADDLDICTVRDRAVWEYLLTRTAGTEMEAEYWLIHGAAGAAEGYLRVPRHHFDAELTVNETSRLSFDAALAALNHLKALSEARGTPGLRLCLPPRSTLARLALSIGAQDRGAYAWQIMVPDAAELLRALRPALEMRLAGSPFAGLTREVTLGFYQGRVRMRFERGRLVELAGLGPGGECLANLPPSAFIPLALGYRGWDEQRAMHPDLWAAAPWRLLLETLFPRLDAFLYTIY